MTCIMSLSQGTYVCVCVCVYIYIYTHTQRELVHVKKNVSTFSTNFVCMRII